MVPDLPYPYTEHMGTPKKSNWLAGKKVGTSSSVVLDHQCATLLLWLLKVSWPQPAGLLGLTVCSSHHRASPPPAQACTSGLGHAHLPLALGPELLHLYYIPVLEEWDLLPILPLPTCWALRAVLCTAKLCFVVVLRIQPGNFEAPA